MKSNNLIKANHNGGIKGRSSTTTAVTIHQQLAQILKDKTKTGALVTSDQSSAFELINHVILQKKLMYLGVQFSSCKLIISFLTDRKQTTQINE